MKIITAIIKIAKVTKVYFSIIEFIRGKLSPIKYPKETKKMFQILIPKEEYKMKYFKLNFSAPANKDTYVRVSGTILASNTAGFPYFLNHLFNANILF